MNVNEFVKGLALGTGSMLVLGLIGGVGRVTYLASVRTISVPLLVEMTLLDRETRAPVAQCLLGSERSAAIEGQAAPRSDARGRLLLNRTYSYSWSALWPFERRRSPSFRFYLGEAPQLGTMDEVETWLVEMRFDEPWRTSTAEIAPVVEVNRSLAYEHSKVRSSGLRPLPAEPADHLAQGRLRMEAAQAGGMAYRVLVSAFLERKAIAACQRPTLGEVKRSATELYNAHRYEESLEAFRQVARREPDSAWAHRGVADALQQLSHPREALPHYRKAIELDPDDLDNVYWYASCLIGVADDEAIQEFRKLVGLEPDKPRGWIGLGIATYGRDRYAESVQAFDRASKLCQECLSPNDRAVYADAKRLAR